MQPVQKIILLVVIILTSALLSNVESANNYPIVLVHGFAGWGRGELFGIPYFGIWSDLELQLNTAGYTVFTAKVGPFSANWHRACELYAQIVGTKVDYGAYHSSRDKYNRYSRDYTNIGFYPQWSSTYKMHFISHSMGGQTIRVIAYLLNKGDLNEQQVSGGSVSPLFAGGHDWVHSLTTLAAPHDGTTLANIINSVGTLVVDLVGAVAALAGATDITTAVYDFYLDEFNLTRNSGESFTDYTNRVFASSIFTYPYQKAISLYDLDTYGASELNGIYTDLPNIYYFSFSTSGTYAYCNGWYWFTCVDWNYADNLNLNPLFWVFGAAMGSYSYEPPGYTNTNTSNNFRQNDGVVSTLGGRYPTLNVSASVISQYTSPGTTSFTSGTWNHLGFQNGWDHFTIIGFDPLTSVESFYFGIASLITNIPAGNGGGSFSDDLSGFNQTINGTHGGNGTVNCTFLIQVYQSQCLEANQNNQSCQAQLSYIHSLGCSYNPPTPPSTGSTVHVSITNLFIFVVFCIAYFFKYE